jgi:cellulose synthase/poly-beta-1,6-N-acetylglucosamine synthase-like glycosyltransferase
MIAIWSFFSSKEEIDESFTPKVTLITTAWNEEKVIQRKIENYLHQAYPKEKVEVIVVDNGSTDKTKEICERYARLGLIKYYRIGKHRELKADALDEAIFELATGEIVLHTDADVVCKPDWLLRMVQPFKDASVAAVTGLVACGNWHQNWLSRLRAIEDTWHLCTAMLGRYNLTQEGICYGANYAFRRKIFEEVKGHGTKTLTEDAELTAKLWKRGYRIEILKEAIVLQEEVTNLSQFFAQRKRWIAGVLANPLHYGTLSIWKLLLTNLFIAANLLIHPLMLLSLILSFFSSTYSLPFLINCFSILIGVLRFRIRASFFLWLIPYVFIIPLLELLSFFLMVKDLTSGIPIRWEKIYHSGVELRSPFQE